MSIKSIMRQTAKQAEAGKDLLYLTVVVFFVYASMPVSTMEGEGLIDYFFGQKKVEEVYGHADCLDIYTGCFIALTDHSHLTVKMPAQVSITEPFDVSVGLNGVRAERVTITFEGVDHSHGLLPQVMNEVTAQSFKAEGMLSYCGYKKMDWQALVTVHTDRTIYKAYFPFQSIDLSADRGRQLVSAHGLSVRTE